MTDAHCHVSSMDSSVREFLAGRDFFGIHPWDSRDFQGDAGEWLRSRLDEAGNGAWVGEIGLDRLRIRDIPPRMEEVFRKQLALAVELQLPVVLHGAKCWGRVVTEVSAAVARRGGCRSHFLFHGFSRSGGLLPEIARLGGFVSAGPAVLNDHAVNYRNLVRSIPDEMLLLETDRTSPGGVRIQEVLEKTAWIRSVSPSHLETVVDGNVERFLAR